MLDVVKTVRPVVENFGDDENAPRVEIYNEAEAEQARQDAVDLLEEEREMALIRSTIYQQDLRRFHARNVRGRAFQEGDLVLRVDQSSGRPIRCGPQPPKH